MIRLVALFAGLVVLAWCVLAMTGLCRAGHDHVHAHPTESYERGWLLHSWEEA